MVKTSFFMIRIVNATDYNLCVSALSLFLPSIFPSSRETQSWRPQDHSVSRRINRELLYSCLHHSINIRKPGGSCFDLDHASKFSICSRENPRSSATWIQSPVHTPKVIGWSLLPSSRKTLNKIQVINDRNTIHKL